MNQISQQRQLSNYELIIHSLRSEQTIGRLVLALGLDGSKDSLNEARQYASSVLMEIERNVGDSNKDLSNCTPNSIVQSMIDAARMRIFIDNRQHAYLIKYGNKATLQIGYRGYVHKIKEHFENADFHYGAIYEGDDLFVNTENGYDHYEVKKSDPFQDNEENLKGVYVAISFTVGGEKRQKLTVLSKNEIRKIRGKAKQDFIWKEWFIEKAYAAAIKRACKIHFASIKELKDLGDYDNENNFRTLNDTQPEVSAENPFETMNKINDEKNKEKSVTETTEKQLSSFDLVLLDIEKISDAGDYDSFVYENQDLISSFSDDERSQINKRLQEIYSGLGM